MFPKGRAAYGRVWPSDSDPKVGMSIDNRCENGFGGGEITVAE